MNKKLQIKPAIGFGELKFGADVKQVEAYLGAPDEKETLEVEGEENEIEVWSYWDQGHAVYFEKENNQVCTNIETDHEEATLFGKPIRSLTENDAIALMKENGYTDFEEEEEDPGERILFFHEAHLQFVFEEGELVLVSWAVAVDDDENILWP